MVRTRWWNSFWAALLVTFVVSCGEDEPEGAWNCWLGRTSPGGNNACSCYRSKLEPYMGSAEVGTSCAQSADTNFLCCNGGDTSCTCRSEEHTSELQSQSNLVCR